MILNYFLTNQVTYEGTPQYPEPPPGGYGPYKVKFEPPVFAFAFHIH